MSLQAASVSALVLPAATQPMTRDAGRSAVRFTAVAHDAFAGVRARWRVLETEGACTGYQRSDWIEGILDNLMTHDRATPVFVEVRDATDGETLMIFPFARIRRFGHTVLTWLDLGVCDYAAPLVASGFMPTGEDMAAVWSSVRAVLPRTDLIHIERITDLLDRVPSPLALLPGVSPMTIQAYRLAIDGPAETLLQRVCPKPAYDKYRKNGRRLAREGHVQRFVVADTPEQVDALFTVLIEQRRARFRTLGRFDLLDRPEVRRFYETQVQAGLASGPARLFGLQIDGQWAAAALAIVHGRTLNVIMPSMDPAWGMVAPGLRIAAEIMLWARHEGLETFDLTIGDLPYKAELGARPRRISELLVPTSLLGAAVMHATRLRVEAKARLKARPDLFERLRKGRQMLRRLAKRHET